MTVWCNITIRPVIWPVHHPSAIRPFSVEGVDTMICPSGSTRLFHLHTPLSLSHWNRPSESNPAMASKLARAVQPCSGDRGYSNRANAREIEGALLALPNGPTRAGVLVPQPVMPFDTYTCVT